MQIDPTRVARLMVAEVALDGAIASVKPALVAHNPPKLTWTERVFGGVTELTIDQRVAKVDEGLLGMRQAKAAVDDLKGFNSRPIHEAIERADEFKLSMYQYGTGGWKSPAASDELRKALGVAKGEVHNARIAIEHERIAPQVSDIAARVRTELLELNGGQQARDAIHDGVKTLLASS